MSITNFSIFFVVYISTLVSLSGRLQRLEVVSLILMKKFQRIYKVVFLSQYKHFIQHYMAVLHHCVVNTPKLVSIFNRSQDLNTKMPISLLWVLHKYQYLPQHIITLQRHLNHKCLQHTIIGIWSYLIAFYIIVSIFYHSREL